MDETQPYNAIVETYTKQETPLEENREQFNKFFSEYNDAIQRVGNYRKYAMDEYLEAHEKSLTKIRRIESVSGICKLTGLTWEETQQKQNDLYDSKIKIRSVTESNKNKYEETSQGLKHLKMDYLQENISTKIEDYRNEMKNVTEIGKDRSVEYRKLNLAGRTTSDYIILSPDLERHKKKKIVAKSLTQINEDIKKVKKIIETVDAMAKELDEKN